MLFGKYNHVVETRGKEVDARSDIFSLDVVLYEMVAGCAPFVGANALEVISEILKTEPAPLKSQAPDAPAELQRIVSKALRKDREERYQVVKDLLLDLKSLKEELIYEANSRATRQPETGDGAMGATSLNQGLDTAKVMGAPSAEISPARATSSAEYLVSQIKRRKLAVFIALLIFVSLAAGIGLYPYLRKTEAPIDSIAVLPFVNQNRAEETEYLADGLTESIINNLAQLPDLRVIARNSVFHFKGEEADLLGAGQALGVRAVVVGRMLQRGENLMVSAELVDVRENKQLWGQQYNRKLADVFAVQEEIAKEISEKLRLKLASAEKQQLAKRPIENLKAFQSYMLGREYVKRRTREDALTAIRYYEKAIAEDNNYALAYVGLAEAYIVHVARSYTAPIEARRQAEEAAYKAIKLDANLAEAHIALALVQGVFAPCNFQSFQELRRAASRSE